MNDGQHIQVAGKLRSRWFDNFDIEAALQFGDDVLILLLRLAGHHWGGGRLQWQAGYETKLGLGKLLSLVDSLGDIIFDRTLFVPIEERDRVFRITLADNQAQEYAVAIRQVLAVNTGRYSVFLFRGIWLRIDDIEDDFPIRSPLELTQKLLDAIPEVLDMHPDLRRNPFNGFSLVEIESNGLFHFSEQRLSALGKRE